MIRVDNVSKTFLSGRGTVRALQDVSLVLEERTTLAICGKSGSGKTTLLNVLGGLERPDCGTVNCFGVPVSTLAAKKLGLFLRRNVGFVFQRGNLLSYLSVFENIAFPLTLNGMGRKERTLRVQELLVQIDLLEAAAALPAELSGGELQRVSFARAIAHRPKMLLADEPTSSLDSATGWKLVNLMFDLGKSQGCTTIVSTHDDEIRRLADCGITLRDGKIVEK